jgi:hypothetical protein
VGVAVEEGVVGTHGGKDTPRGDPNFELLASRHCPTVEPLVPRLSLPLLRRVGGSFFVGVLAGLAWALLVIHRRPSPAAG